MSDVVIDVKNVTIRFNMASEKIEHLKEYLSNWSRESYYFRNFWR